MCQPNGRVVGNDLFSLCLTLLGGTRHQSVVKIRDPCPLFRGPCLRHLDESSKSPQESHISDTKCMFRYANSRANKMSNKNKHRFSIQDSLLPQMARPMNQPLTTRQTWRPK